MGTIKVLIVIILAIGIPSIILFFLYKWLAKKGYKKVGALLLASIISYLVFSIYTAFYPLNDFYKQEFEHNTGLNFPKSGVIINKDSSYPDQHGDYWASAIINLDSDEYETLKTNLLKQKDFQIDTTRQGLGITTNYTKLAKNINKEDVEVIYLNTNKQWFKVAFLKNKKTIIFERASS